MGTPSLTHFHYDVDFVTSPRSAREEALATAVLHLERLAARGGWDGPVRVFALVAGDGPGLGPEASPPAGPGDAGLTAIEQTGLPPATSLASLLKQLWWPPTVDGAAVVVEQVLEGRGGDVRLVGGALRTGETWCAVRMRQHDADDLVLSAADLVPDLLGMIQGTLAD